jgi:hypothetical protein
MTAGLIMALLAACSSKKHSSVAGTTSTTAPPTSTSGGAPGPTTTSTTATAAPSNGPRGGPVPAGFVPASVTFVSLTQGWVLGTAPCPAQPCTSVVRTADGGKTWTGIPAPKATLNDATAGVRAIRFADARDGWAFGPSLWSTHDGGATWHHVSVPGLPAGSQVVSLEAATGAVHLAALGEGDGLLHIATSLVGVDAFTLSPASQHIGGGPVPTAQIVLYGSSGWLIQVDRTVVGGARYASATWQGWTPPCATVQGPAVMAAASPSQLVAACNVGEWGGSPAGEHLYTSSNGGSTFADAGAIPIMSVDAIAASSKSVAVVAGQISDGLALKRTTDGGKTWTQVFTGTAPGGWADLGFTSPSQGVVVDTGGQNNAGAQLLMSSDAGATWRAVRF